MPRSGLYPVPADSMVRGRGRPAKASVETALRARTAIVHLNPAYAQNAGVAILVACSRRKFPTGKSVWRCHSGRGGVIGNKTRGEPMPDDRTLSRGAIPAGVPAASSGEDPADPVFAAIAEFHAALAAYTDVGGGAQAKTAAYTRLLVAVNGLNVPPATRVGAAALLRVVAANQADGDDPYLWDIKWFEDPQDAKSRVVVATCSFLDILETVAVALERMSASTR
jgi:hypothetical protein